MNKQPSEEAIREALKKLEWIYEIDHPFIKDETVPLQAVKGACKVEVRYHINATTYLRWCRGI